MNSDNRELNFEELNIVVGGGKSASDTAAKIYEDPKLQETLRESVK